MESREPTDFIVFPSQNRDKNSRGHRLIARHAITRIDKHDVRMLEILGKRVKVKQDCEWREGEGK